MFEVTGETLLLIGLFGLILIPIHGAMLLRRLADTNHRDRQFRAACHQARVTTIARGRRR